VEEEKESMEGKFQEFEIIDEEFEHECVEDEDSSQGFVDWDSPPTYAEDINEEDSIEEPLTSDLEEEHKEDGFFPMFSGLYPNEEDQLGDEESIDDIVDHKEGDIADYEEVDEGLSGEVSNYNEEEVEYVHFLGVEDILSSPNNDIDEFYTDEENYLFIREVTADPFLSIFMAHGREKEQEKYGKSKVLPSGVWGIHDKHQGISLMGSVTPILGCCLVLILSKGERNELTGHPKDRGKDQPNLRTNSLKHGGNDADQIEFRASLLLCSILRSSAHLHSIILVPTLERTRDLMLILLHFSY
jgi:hypothetical protein